MWALNHAFLRAHNKPMWYIYIYLSYNMIYIYHHIYIIYIDIQVIRVVLQLATTKFSAKKEWIAQWSTCCSEETAVKCWETILRWQTAANNTARRLIRSGNLSQQWKTPPLISASECFPGLKLGVSWSFHDIQPLSQIQERAPTQESERLFILKISQDLSVKEVSTRHASVKLLWTSCMSWDTCPWPKNDKFERPKSGKVNNWIAVVKRQTWFNQPIWLLFWESHAVAYTDVGWNSRKVYPGVQNLDVWWPHLGIWMNPRNGKQWHVNVRSRN